MPTRFDPNFPFNDLPGLPGGFDFDSPRILKKALAASHALAKANAAAAKLPDPSLFYAPFLVRESLESSAVENIRTTMFEALMADAVPEKAEGPQKEVLNYKAALTYGLEKVRERGFVHTVLLEEIQAIVEPDKGGIRRMPVFLKNGAGETVYTPPVEEDRIRRLLMNLDSFVNASDDGLDPLVKIGAAHYQFEAIHPFLDGNGRVWRISLILMLVLAWKLEHPVVFPSAYVNRNKSEYYAALRAVDETDGDFTLLTEFLLSAIESESNAAAEKISSAIALMEKVRKILSEKYPKYPDSVIRALFSNPFFRIDRFAELVELSRPTAEWYKDVLEGEGILARRRFGRAYLYYMPEFVETL